MQIVRRLDHSDRQADPKQGGLRNRIPLCLGNPVAPGHAPKAPNPWARLDGEKP
jgi:hypothetical protein